MTTVQFGFCMPAESHHRERWAAWVDDLNSALTLISGHFDSAWIVDHLMFEDTAVLESFTTLSYMAALHPQLKFGHAVLCQSFRNPALVAKMAATLQLLSQGRYLFGIGAGWHEAEYSAYGYDFPSDGIRVNQLEEAVQIIRGMWTQEKTTFEGIYHRVTDAFCEPKPDPTPPIMIGAFRPKMLRLTAKYADWWNVSSTAISKYRQMVTMFEQACDDVKRDPASIKRSWIGGCACAPTEEKAKALTEGRWSAEDENDFGFVGTPEQIIDQMQPFIQAGITYFMFDCGGFPDLTTLHMLIDEVLPAL